MSFVIPAAFIISCIRNIVSSCLRSKFSFQNVEFQLEMGFFCSNLGTSTTRKQYLGINKNMIQKCKDSDLRLFVILGQSDKEVRQFCFTMHHIPSRNNFFVLVENRCCNRLKLMPVSLLQVYGEYYFPSTLNYCPYILLLCLITFGILENEFLLNIIVG